MSIHEGDIASDVTASEVRVDPAAGPPDLHRNVLPWWAMYATAIGSVAPTAGLAAAIAGVSLTAGNGSWLTWIVVTIGICGVSYCISSLARRYSTSGGLYGMGALVGGRVGGYLQGAPQLLALLIALPALVIGAGIYVVAFLEKCGVGESHVLYLVVFMAVIALTLLFALADVKISARALIILELSSAAFIVSLLIIVLFNHSGSLISHDQLSLKGLTVHDLFLGIAFATYSIAGFENTATLGKEAKDPTRDIPRAMLGTVLIIGVLYVFASYVQILALPNGQLGESAAPLSSVAEVAGVGWYSWIIDVCIAVSFFSCLLAASNTAARVLFTLGRDGVLPKMFGKASASHGEPSIALFIILTLTAVASAIFALIATPVFDSYAYVGTLSGYMFIGVYSAAIVLAVMDAVKYQSLRALLVLAALVGAAMMGLAIYFSFVPLPEGPYRTVFWIFVALIAVALANLAFALLLKPRWWQRIGASLKSATEGT